MDEQLTYRIAFASLRGVSTVFATEVLNRLGSEEAFFRATPSQLGAVLGSRNKLMDSAYRQRLLDEARREADFVSANGIRPIYYTDKDYPQLMTRCEDAPLLLYALGGASLNAPHTLSIVGTRHITPYGLEFTDRLVKGLADKVEGGVTVVSGLAYGVDVAAHKAALRYGLPTIGVLAHGLNTIYPAVHRSVAADIVRQGGALVTDYRSTDAVHKGNFLARNRIVAGMSHCTLVVESARKGGAMVTAKIASGYSRDVFALPGRTSDVYSQGCNKLISLCVAKLVQDADELIADMRWPVVRKDASAEQQVLFDPLPPDQKAVAQYLNHHGEAQLNKLSVELDIPVGRLMSALIDLEFRGMVTAYPGGTYRRSAP